MISSEVERTLVKSPPELWAELSDPTSLSRHLGELGEIRIVRTEPESTVEWTADNTTGTVSLKPSGWGTKVTLSVTRELDEPTAGAEQAPDVASATESTPESEAQEPEAALEPGPAQDAQPEREPEPELEPEREAAPGEPEKAQTQETPELTADGLEAPREPTAPLELEPQLTTASDPAPPEARRGFFARLFGRRRARSRERDPIEDSETADAEPVGAETTTPSDLADQHANKVEQIAPADEPSAAAPEPAIETESESEVAAGPSSEHGDAFAAIRQALAPETVASAHLFATRPGSGRREPIETPAQAQARAPVPGAQPQAAPTADAPEPPQAPSDGLTADASTPTEEPAVDIAAELLAAEEVASEQVRAVLTAVLDRLGAAHHRPFSRA